jgi:hypothetical protein
VHKTVVLRPHAPSGWGDMRLEDLPVGTNTISFSRRKTGQGIAYRIEASEDGWTFVLRPESLPGSRYFVNGKLAPDSADIRLTGRVNDVTVLPHE